jgi:hypothetical protein
MSNTAKAKVEVAAKASPVEASEAAPAPRSRVTPLADIPGYEALIDRRFKRKDGSTQDVFTPKGITPWFIMEENQMDETSNICARFYVERSSNGEPEPPTHELILGRPVRARAPAKSFFQDCALFVEQFEEVRS